MSHESKGKSDEWYTPKYIFEALGCSFDMDVSSPVDRKYCSVIAQEYITEKSLDLEWRGFVWMNPPYGNEKQKELWLNKLINHGDGIALMPNRTNANWWQIAAENCTCLLFTFDKIKFIDQNGITGNSPSTGNTLFAFGETAEKALYNAQNNGLGIVLK